MERHRLQKIVLDKLAASLNLRDMKVLHFAPEPHFLRYFKEIAGHYTSIDLNMAGVMLHADILALPFKSAVFDLVFASHVPEHIKDDMAALSEIRRVLTDQGIAILPVPIVAEQTIEYREPNPYEAEHIRAPAPDYFQRFRSHFSRVDIYSSEDFSPGYQTFIFEKRDHWPTEKMPLRKPMAGDRHPDFVPVCFV
jgi:SAM-dependent methyltransferase